MNGRAASSRRCRGGSGILGRCQIGEDSPNVKPLEIFRRLQKGFALGASSRSGSTSGRIDFPKAPPDSGASARPAEVPT